MLFVSSYQGHTLEWIANAYCRLVVDDEVELARFRLTGGVPQTGVVMAKLFRDGELWRLRAIGEGIAVKVPTESARGPAPPRANPIGGSRPQHLNGRRHAWSLRRLHE